MKTIEIKTTYTLFKPVRGTNEVGSTLEYVRILSNTNAKIHWAMGYENVMGTVSIIGGELSKETQDQLEKEYQNAIVISNNNKMN